MDNYVRGTSSFQDMNEIFLVFWYLNHSCCQTSCMVENHKFLPTSVVFSNSMDDYI